MKFKSTLLLITTFCIALGTQAQNYYAREYSYYHVIDYYDNFTFTPNENLRKKIYELRAKNNVSASQKVKLNHKRDTVARIKTIYNRKGRISSVESIDQKGNKFEIKVSYFNDTLLTNYVKKSNKELIEISYKYNEKGWLTHLLRLKNGEKKFEVKKTYQGGKLKESVSFFYKNRKTESSKMVNTFNEEDKMIKTAYYKNDKLERVWEYDCSEKGTEVKPKNSKEDVPSTTYCSWEEESSDGSYILYSRAISGKGYVLYENHYDKDSVLVKRKIYDGKERLIYESTNYKNHRISLNYKANGKIRRHFSEYFDPELGVISTSSVFYGLGKSHNSSQKSYNEKGLLVEEMGSSNGKLSKSTITYSYSGE